MVPINITSDLEYLAVFITVLILPKLVQRFKIPSGITALIIGIVLTRVDPAVSSEPLFRFLSQIGITSLFLFAGLEVEISELREDKGYLVKYLGKYTLVLAVVAFCLNYIFGWSWQVSLIFSLGILTPSAGFILNSLHSFSVNEDHEYWIKSKAISKEIVSIMLMFIALQWAEPKKMVVSSLFFIGLFIVLPKVFRLFFKFISPYAPNSEIPFLVALSLISGVISKELGAYYLIGAFIVGVIGSQFKNRIFKDGEEALFRSLSGFFNVFLPFYFFYAGTKINLSHVSLNAFFYAIALFVIFIPLRLLLIKTSLRFFMKETIEKTYKVSFSLMPTLIFGLVISGILIERKLVPYEYAYALILYTILTSIFPSIMFSLKRFKDH